MNQIMYDSNIVGAPGGNAIFIHLGPKYTLYFRPQAQGIDTTCMYIYIYICTWGLLWAIWSFRDVVPVSRALPAGQLLCD